jgi:hypothetical protein
MPATGQIVFGAGIGVATPFGANAPANPTPIQFPIAQDLSIDISADKAELYGADQYPYGIARTKAKIDIKAKIGSIYAQLLSDLFFGSTYVVGQTLFATNEQVTVSISGSGTVLHASGGIQDAGVINAATGQQYTRDIAAPTLAGHYEVTVGTGTYAFFTSDPICTAPNNIALITYAYTSSTAGKTANVTNKPMGAMPQFDFKYMNNQFGSNLYLQFYRAICNKLTLPNKNTEFEMPDMDMSCFAQNNGQVFVLSLDQ